MLRTARGTQALIDLEDRAPDVLFEHVHDSPVPLWPQLRGLVSIALNQLDYQIAPVAAPEPARVSAWAALARSFLPTRWDAALAHGRRPLCFLMGGTTVHGVGGKERNWLIGDYVDLNPERSSVVQWRPLPSHLGPPEFHRAWSLDPATTRAAGFARLSRRDPEREVRTIVAEVCRQLDVELRAEQVAAIATAAVYHERLRPHIDRAYGRVIGRLDPSVVLMEDASYGGWASLVAMMKSRGIVVAEPQHGWIGPTHAAYNFGAAMHRGPLRETLPDHLLTFGEYWGRGLRHPGRVTPVGKPHIESAAAVARASTSDRNEVLVVSSTGDPDEMTSFVLALREMLHPSWTVVFRPHPSERAVLWSRYPGLESAQGVLVDTGGDVYESLRTAAVVVGVASTVLFEALAFGCRVFVRDSPLVDYYVGDLFGPAIASRAELVGIADQINSGEFGSALAAVPSEDMWAPGALSRFQTWLAALPQSA